MFDRTVVVANRRPQHVYVNNHEHRAPTDKSVELLKDFEKAARDKITESVAIGDNGFEAVVHVEYMAYDNATKTIVIFSLNGRRMTVEHIWRGYKITDRQKYLTELRELVAQRIAADVLGDAFARLGTLPIFAKN